MKSIEYRLERFMFASRWLLAPFYIGLVGAIAILLFKFVKEFITLLPQVFTLDGGQIMVSVLTLVDVALVANLLLIIVFAGYENFVSKIHTGDSEDRPEWMGHVTFSDLKIKLIGSIVAISGIELLKAFVNIDNYSDKQIAWKIGLHLTFVLSGVLFAVMDRLTAGKSGGH
ncbi:MAG: TIGR00645 family protein [Proteobacteria bacterium]|nr:TIGR00645 family protein [Burkholderiales bacterium]MCA0309457.1 TIGR00645 family protein [Pseudomonadota bacterium]